MASSSLELLDSIDILTVEKKNTTLEYPSDCAQKIANILDGKNPSLYNEWLEVRDFYHQIKENISLALEDLYESIQIFAEQSMVAEKEVENAVTNANAETEKILSDLEM